MNYFLSWGGSFIYYASDGGYGLRNVGESPSYEEMQNIIQRMYDEGAGARLEISGENYWFNFYPTNYESEEVVLCVDVFDGEEYHSVYGTLQQTEDSFEIVLDSPLRYKQIDETGESYTYEELPDWTELGWWISSGGE